MSIKYTEYLAEAGIGSSVGSVGNSYDNALAEVIDRRGPWRSFKAVEFATSGNWAVTGARMVSTPAATAIAMILSMAR